MPKVKNWQLGREMDYPYEEAHSERQIAMVFDVINNSSPLGEPNTRHSLPGEA